MSIKRTVVRWAGVKGNEEGGVGWSQNNVDAWTPLKTNCIVSCLLCVVVS